MMQILLVLFAEVLRCNTSSTTKVNLIGCTQVMLESQI